MEFRLFVEGETEQKAVPAFLKKWLDPRLSTSVGIKAVRFDGWPELVKDSPTKAKLYLSQNNVIAVIALLDLYGPTIYPKTQDTPTKRYTWAKQHLEQKVDNPRFFQFFAVHEVEAWLLCDPSIFPPAIKPSVDKISQNPEAVNNTTPPSKRLDNIYKRETKRSYKKVTHGKYLFSHLDPNKAIKQCPHLKQLLEKMLKLAKEAGH